MDIKSVLNTAQYLAVTTIEGPVLVIAGAGSGKTRVIEYRALNLILNGIDPCSILLLTFTRRAAYSMLSRASTHNIKCQNIEGGTFHSFAYKMLKKYGGACLNIPESFLILDEADAEDAIQRCINLTGAAKQKGFPKKGTIKDIFGKAINTSSSLEDIVCKEYYFFLDYLDQLKSIMNLYTKYKKDSGYLDYDDLLLYFNLLLQNKNIHQRITSRYHYIMVDEYQDTNQLQGDITYLLAGEKKNIMAVGDDAQSIYGFRGASHLNIMEFSKRFLGCKIIKMEENYRSTQEILDVGNQVLQNMENKYSKCLVAVKRAGGDKPCLFRFDSPYDEAEWVLNTVRQHKDEGVPLGSQAILFRASYISIPLQAELTKIGIPYRFFGGKKFYESAHIKDVLSYLKVLVNPKDEISWHRILKSVEGVGIKTSQQIYKNIVTGIFKNLSPAQSVDLFIQNNKHRGPLQQLLGMLKKTESLRQDITQAFRTITDYYFPILKDNYDDWTTRMQDINILWQVSSRYDSLQDMLSDFAIEGTVHNNDKMQDALVLSTIHSAKGLEWDNVFIIGLMDGVLPSAVALKNDNDIEEESRLLYVAVTRARHQLFLSMHNHPVSKSNRWNGWDGNELSRFLNKRNVLEKLNRR